MEDPPAARRSFLKKAAALAVAAPAVASLGSTRAHAMSYDPAAKLRDQGQRSRNSGAPPPAGMLMARIYQPQGPGPFPTLLDLHGGAWNDKDRFANEPMDRASRRAACSSSRST